MEGMATATSGATAQPQAGGQSTGTKAATSAPPPPKSATESGQGAKQPAGSEPGSAPKPKIDLSKFKDLSNEEFAELVKTRKHAAKVNGKVEEIDYDSLRDGYQTHKAATEKFEAAARERKALEDRQAQFQKEYLEDMAGALQKAGKSREEIREYMENYLAEVYQQEDLAKQNPHLAKMKEIEAENARLKAEKTEREQRELAQQDEAAINHWVDTFDVQIGEALGGSGLPQDPEFVKKAAAYIAMGVQNGVEISAKQAVDWVKKDFQAGLSAALSKLDDAALLDIVPAEVVKRIGLASLNRIRAKRQSGFSNPEQKPTPSKKDQKSGVKMDDFFANARKLAGIS